MSNVLSTEKKQQVIALGRLGWPLRRIEQATGVRRETAGSYLRAAGIAVRPPGGWGKRAPSKPANGVTTDSGSLDLSKLDLPAASEPPSASACAPYRRSSNWNWGVAATPCRSGKIWFPITAFRAAISP